MINPGDSRHSEFASLLPRICKSYSKERQHILETFFGIQQSFDGTKSDQIII